MYRKPQINFQVEPAMKLLYEEIKAAGYRPTRLCAAGLLLMVEDATLRVRALRRLQEWEIQHADASPGPLRQFLQNVWDTAPTDRTAKPSCRSAGRHNRDANWRQK